MNVLQKNTKGEHDIFRKASRTTELKSAVILYPLCSGNSFKIWSVNRIGAQVKESLETEVDKFFSIVLLCRRMISVAAQFLFLRLENDRDQRFLNAVFLSKDKSEVWELSEDIALLYFPFVFSVLLLESPAEAGSRNDELQPNLGGFSSNRSWRHSLKSTPPNPAGNKEKPS